MLGAMMLARALESALLARADCGFQLLSSGQEAVAVGVAAALLPHDQLLCSGRAIAPALARGLDPRGRHGRVESGVPRGPVWAAAGEDIYLSLPLVFSAPMPWSLATSASRPALLWRCRRAATEALQCACLATGRAEQAPSTKP